MKLTAKQEIEADKLAMQILVPTKLLKDYLSVKATKEKLVTGLELGHLAQLFQVNKAVIAQRLEDLGYYVPYIYKF